MTQIIPPLFAALLLFSLGACGAPQQTPADGKTSSTPSQPGEIASASPVEKNPATQDPGQPKGPETPGETPSVTTPQENTPAEPTSTNKPPATNKYSIVGKWQFKFPPEALEEMQKSNIEAPESIFTFTANGKWTLVTATSKEKRSLAGTYTLNGNQVTLTLKEADGEAVEDPRVQPLVVTLSEDGNRFTSPAWEGGYFIRISGKT